MKAGDRARARKRARQTEGINIEDFPHGQKTEFYISVYQDAFGTSLQAPFIVVRGASDGPVLGLSAAVHGNELNGIRIIQNLVEELDPRELRGSLLCAPVVNVPAFNAGQRYFIDHVDINSRFPGKAGGTPSEQYARGFTRTFLPSLDYLIDIHTASEGRTNTMYVRVDLERQGPRTMALNMNPQIILHNRGGDGTLRNAAQKKRIDAITLEAGNPSVIQGKMVFDGELGIRNVMKSLDMLPGQIEITRDPVICRSSKWLRTEGGGILETLFKLNHKIAKDQLLARTRDPFGRILQEYRSPHDGIVIGMAANPVAIPGTRFCHLGEIGDPSARVEPPAAERAVDPEVDE